MTKRKNPDTSIAAFHSLDQSKVQELKNKIMEALKVLGKGTSEQIADYLGKEYDQVWKRCSDLKNEKKIFASDSKVLTKKKRFARQWVICDGAMPKTDKQVAQELKGKPTIADYSRDIASISNNTKQFRQPELF